jgi:hypothetical protein
VNLLKIIAGPVIGARGSVAMGRVAFLIAFGISVYFWLCRPVDVYPPTLSEILIALMVYNFTSKGVNSFGKRGRECSPDSPA